MEEEKKETPIIVVQNIHRRLEYAAEVTLATRILFTYSSANTTAAKTWWVFG